VISVPKRLGGVRADRPAAVTALTRIFLDEIERWLNATVNCLPRGPRRAELLQERRASLALLCPARLLGEGRGEGARNHEQPRSHDTSRIAWAKLIARIAEDFPLACPACGGDIRLIAFITDPAPIRKILTYLGEPLEPPPLAPARGPPTAWAELVQAHDDRDAIQSSPDDLPVIDIRGL
jgi:hypothetical protein